MAITITGSSTTGLSNVILTNVYAGNDYVSDAIEILSTNNYTVATNVTIPFTLDTGVTLGDVASDLTIYVNSGTNQRALTIGGAGDFTASVNTGTTPDQIEIAIDANVFAAADLTAGAIELIVGIPMTQEF